MKVALFARFVLARPSFCALARELLVSLWLRPALELLVVVVQAVGLFQNQRLLENEPPVFLDLWLQLGIIEEGAAIREQAESGDFLVQFESQHAQVALVLLLLARELANEDVILVDDIDAKAAEISEPMSATLPTSRNAMRLHMAQFQAEIGLDFSQSRALAADFVGNLVYEIDVACRAGREPLD